MTVFGDPVGFRAEGGFKAFGYKVQGLGVKGFRTVGLGSIQGLRSRVLGCLWVQGFQVAAMQRPALRV